MSIPLDMKLIETVDGFNSHKFLRNPASQNIYLYLTSFVKMLSEHHFLKQISDLEYWTGDAGKDMLLIY